jgi:hypothetical protein
MPLNTEQEKRDYYVYDSRPWRFKEAPTLNPQLREVMKRERLDRAYRFVWGGVVIVREEPDSQTFTIARGSRDACHAVNGVYMPKYSFSRSKQARGYCYYNDLNQKVCVTREEFIPPGVMSRVDYRYVDFGILRWYLEQRGDAEDLINAHVYNARDVVPEHEWTCVMPLNTKKGQYYEPGLEMIEVLQQREWESANANLMDVARKLRERREKKERDEEAAEDEAGAREFALLESDLLKEHSRQTRYSMPNFIAPVLKDPMGLLRK